jgi:triosephosphate isomerase
MRKPRGVLIAGNWKMNHGGLETQEFFSQLRLVCSPKPELELDPKLHPIQVGQLKVCIFPPLLSLYETCKQASTLAFPLSVGAQNAHWAKKGAFTGEISGPMLTELGVQWVLVGHSERRQFFGETNQTAHLRCASLLAQGFHVIFCIGETLAERESGETSVVLQNQIQEAFGVHSKDFEASFEAQKLIIAYEPVWAIGTGLTATPQQIESSHQLIREKVGDLFTARISDHASLLYGGSVTPENIDSILNCPNVDGVLVGGASLKPTQLLALLESGARALQSV